MTSASFLRSESALREHLVTICHRLYRQGMIAAGDGNVSCKLGDDRVLVTPTGFHKGFIKPEDLINFDKPLPVIVALFEYLRDNAALMHAILGLRGDVALQTKIRKSLERNLKFGALSGGRPLTFLAPAEYLIAYGLSASFGVVQLWLERGCAETPREMAVILTRLSLGGAVRAIVVG